jgi:hypothetical protein
MLSGITRRHGIATSLELQPAEKNGAIHAFSKDVSAKVLPDYSIIVPDLNHDANNGTMAAADAWLKQNLAGVLSSSYFASGHDGVLFVTFDNANGDAQGHVFTTVIGPSVDRKVKDGTAFRHENTLRTIIKLLGLSVFPGASSSVSSMMSEFSKVLSQNRAPHYNARPKAFRAFNEGLGNR